MTKKRKPGRPKGSKNKSGNTQTLNSSNDLTEITDEYINAIDKKRRVRDEIWAVVLLALGVFLAVAFQTTAAGTAGLGLVTFFKGCFGALAFVLPYYLMVYGGLLFMRGTIHIGSKAVILLAVIFLFATLINSATFINSDGYVFGAGVDAVEQYYSEGIELKSGGLVGMYIGGIIERVIGIVGLYIFSIVGIIICVMLIINTPVSHLIEEHSLRKKIRNEKEREADARMTEKRKAMGNVRSFDDIAEFDEKTPYADSRKEAKNRKRILDYVNDSSLFGKKGDSVLDEPFNEMQEKPEDCSCDEDYREVKEFDESADGRDVFESAPLEAPAVAKAEETEAEIITEVSDVGEYGKYKFPPMSILSKGDGKNSDRSDAALLRNGAQKLEDTLASFKVDAKVIDVTRGPAVTRYEIQPGPGVKVSSIVGLANDIALNMEARNIRIEAPIPGKRAVGIEIGNDRVSMVTLRDIIDTDEFKKAKSKISFAVGRDISGKSIVADLKKMPHLLIAGSTGSGKSVCINSIIASFLYKARPDEVKLILVDPKVVELSNYNGIPHLLIPVVTEPSKAAAALGWACAEMDERYKKFAEEGVRNLEGYNKAVKDLKDGEKRPLPQIVVVIDELADLMMEASSQVEDCICRLTQKARAAGMHLIVATQRPSVDVITGVIKANIPSRIAFMVSSQTDSRTILDMGGAEKLVGNGDMLYYPAAGGSKPVRVQGTFISNEEVAALIDHVKGQVKEAEYSEEVIDSIETQGRPFSAADDTDELLNDAIELVVTSGQASTSMLQRRFRVGYNRAARMMDMMEERGIIGPSDGTRPRQVFMTEDELNEPDESTEDI